MSAQPWDRIPEELRERPQWLIAGPNNFGEMKLPQSVASDGTLFAGSSTNRANWLTFERACEVASARGMGIGYVLSADDPFSCIDLDVKAHTTQPQRDRHQQIVQAFDSYTEYSQSGVGLHVWVIGKVGKGKKRDGVELYSQERFIACTGNVRLHKPIAECQELLDRLVSEICVKQGVTNKTRDLDELEEIDDDETILARARTATNKEKFVALCNGDWTAMGYASQSEADMALMALFAFYSRSNEQCRRLFRQTALGKREKAQDDDRYIDLTLKKIRGRMEVEAAQVAQCEILKVTGADGIVNESYLTPPKMSLEQMRDALVLITDGSFIAFRNNPAVMLQRADFKTYVRSCITTWTVFTAQGPKEISRETFELWLADKRGRKSVHTTTFDPRYGEFCDSPDGIAALNLYRPRPHTAPTDWEERVAPFLTHVAYLVPVLAERNAFLDWLSHIEQHPGVLPHSGYLMIAPVEGIGRNTLADTLACVWSGHVACDLNLAETLSSTFNDQLSRKFLAVVDEINEGQNTDQWKHAERLKTLVTAAVRNINPKYGRKRTELNCCRWLLFSNHESAIPLKAGDRRWHVVRNPASPQEPGYYVNLRREIADPLFIASVREWLKHRDLSKFNPGARPELNEAKAAVVEATRSEATVRAIEMVQDWPRECITASDFCREIYGVNHTHGQLSGIKNRALEAGIQKWTGNGAGRVRVGGHMTTIWILRNPSKWVHASTDAVVAEATHTPSSWAPVQGVQGGAGPA